ncbi:MAG: serpin family protein [Bacteroidetes bacterium HGW-Bacteroidetes-9]|jgi:serpin B|nr:MAG: serpin family protein [Bacteroidetes bacterium HGW-Bacteroidetes-9]
MKYSVIFLLMAFCLISGCSKDDMPSGPQNPKAFNLTQKDEQIINISNHFGINLFRETALADDGNLMLSPLSASTALTMLLNGCNTETYNQIRNMLGYDSLLLDEINNSYKSLVQQLLNLDPETNLALANSAWYRKDFMVKQTYLDQLNNYFDAKTEALDFNSPSALETINNWAKDNTNGKIEKVLDNISSDAVMFLMNALYFNGNWTYRFDKNKTSLLPFNSENNIATDVEMMRGEFPFRMHSNNNCTAIEINYGRQNFAMDIIVPKGTLTEYLNELNTGSWQSIIEGLDAIPEPTSAELIVPKFRFDYEKYLNDELKALGMTYAFDPTLADLSGISDANIYVSFVKQNTFVDMNEEGTEAAAVTTVGIYDTSAPLPFIVDKPFIFAIRERISNTLLFIGKVELPVY